MEHAEWFIDWFDSPYYHLLYNHRNYEEADLFIQTLCTHLRLAPNANVWDLACGKGRHSIALAKRGYRVTGTDLSKSSIKQASLHSHEKLDFMVHDMRHPFKTNYFDTVFNLFTSIGYFKDKSDNALVFNNVYTALKPDGLFVIDFLNSEKFCDFPKTEYEEKRDDIIFKIRKQRTNDAIVKRIEFSAQGKHYYFEEHVTLLRYSDFETFAGEAGFHLEQCYGNYQLQPFVPEQSERLILILKK